MRPVVILSMIVLLAGCARLQTGSEQGFINQAGWRREQAIRDANIIVQGMNRARAEEDDLARRSTPQEGGVTH
jgi:hypothetical protein